MVDAFTLADLNELLDSIPKPDTETPWFLMQNDETGERRFVQPYRNLGLGWRYVTRKDIAEQLLRFGERTEPPKG